MKFAPTEITDARCPGKKVAFCRVLEVAYGKPMEVAIEKIVPGDIVLLHAGDVIPGDSILLESNNLSVNEAALTGEMFPVEKTPGVLPPETPLNKRTNVLFTGTYAVSGTGTALIVKTGTLPLGEVQLNAAVNVEGKPSGALRCRCRSGEGLLLSARGQENQMSVYAQHASLTSLQNRRRIYIVSCI